MTERDPFIEHMEFLCNCNGDNFEIDFDNEAVEMIEELTTSLVRKNLYHAALCTLIRECLGEGNPLDVLLRDAFMRHKFNLAPRAL